MIRPALKLFLIVTCIGLFFILVWPLKKSGKIHAGDKLICICNRLLLKICGVRLLAKSKASGQKPMMIVCNHISYMDVPILGSLLPVRFTPKSEISGWPLISSLCSVTGCIFLTRRADKIEEAKNAIKEALAKEEVVCLYPEGTTGNGIETLPFKSSFFSMAEEGINGRELYVQPVAIIYRAIGRLPIDRTQWPQIAWYGDMEFVPHFWDFLKLNSLDVEIDFLPPVSISQFTDRKSLAEYCRQAIQKTIEAARKENLSPAQKRLMPSLRLERSK